MKKDLPEYKFAGRQVTFVFNSFVPTGMEDYVEFFKANFIEFIYLRWRFPHAGKHGPDSRVQVFKNCSCLEKKLFSFSVSGNKFVYFLLLPLNYLLCLFQALKLIPLLRDRKPVVYMGVNYFCALCGIVLKYLGAVDFVIYRVMDFFPLPKQGIYCYLNRVFYLLDSFCLRHSDSIWFTTEGHIIGREERGYFNRKKQPYRIIPLGVNSSRFISKEIGEHNRYSLLYCGMISRHHLLGLIFDCVKELKKEFPRLKLNLIGSGPDLEYFKELASRMELKENIVFHGFMEDSREFTRLISDNLLGFALYEDEDGLMKYTEPAKVKYYLNFGVPAVISRIPRIAFELEKEKVSFAVNNDKTEICRCVKDFILNSEKQTEYKNNIAKYIKGIDINNLIKNNIVETFSSLRINA
jgi:glycosyltransferase involved in cell wall biosynthesis